MGARNRKEPPPYENTCLLKKETKYADYTRGTAHHPVIPPKRTSDELYVSHYDGITYCGHVEIYIYIREKMERNERVGSSHSNRFYLYFFFCFSSVIFSIELSAGLYFNPHCSIA